MSKGTSLRTAARRCTHFEGNREQIKFNTGVVYLRPTPQAKAFVRAWLERLLTSGHLVYDQEAFNQVCAGYRCAGAPRREAPGPDLKGCG